MSRWIMEGAPTLQTHCWESMIATVGSGLQPAAAIRHCRRSSSCMFSVAPRSFHPVPTASAANDAAPREDAALPPDPDMPSHQSCQARLLGQGHHRHQASPRHQIRGHRTSRGSSPDHATIALARCPLNSGTWKLQQLPSSQFRGHLSRRRAQMGTHLHGGSRLRGCCIGLSMTSRTWLRFPR